MFFRKFLKFALSGLILLAGFLWLIQTPFGFQHVLTPALSLGGIGTLDAAHGRLDLRGKLVLTDAQYRYEEAGIEASLQSGSIAIDLLSLFGNAPIAIESVEIQQGTLVLTDAPAESASLSEANPVAPEAEANTTKTALRLPFSVGLGVLSDFTYRQIHQSGDTVIEAESLRLEDLEAGKQGSLTSLLHWRNQNATGTGAQVHAEIKAQLSLNERNNPRNWKLQVEASQGSGGGNGKEAIKTLNLAIQAQHDGEDHLKAEMKLSGKESGKQFGSLSGEIILSGLASPSLMQSLHLDTSTEIDHLSLGSVLSFLPPSPSRPKILGELDGSIQAVGTLAGPLDIKTEVAIEGLRIEGSPVSARELKIGITASSKLEKGGDMLEIAELKIKLGEGHLKARGSASPQTSSFSIQIEAQEFPVATALALGGLDTAKEFGALPLNGEIKVQSDADASLTLSGSNKLAVLLPKAKTPEFFILKTELQSKKDGSITTAIEGTNPPHAGNFSITATIEKTTEVTVNIKDMNLTSLVQPFLDAKPIDEEAPPPIEKIPLPETVAEKRATKADPLLVHLDIDQSRYRDVHVGKMKAEFSRTVDKIHVEVTGSDVSKGDIDFQIDSSEVGADRLQWKGSGKGIRLQPLMDAFAGSTTVGGKLQFETSGLSREPIPAPAIDGLNGSINLHLRDGKLEGFKALDLLAKATGINLMGAFAFSKLDGSIEIESGTARIKDLQAGGAIGNIQAFGTVDLKGPGAIDMKINPRVGPSVAGLLKGIKPIHAILGTAEGLLSLPINIAVSGPFADPKYAVVTQGAGEAVSSRGGKLVGQILDGVTLGGSSALLGALLPSKKSEEAAAAPQAGTNSEKPGEASQP
ncbi:MAG: AsmA-like C-terminal region-containing protein [Candidatus Binatia bacterium]|nr:AsmA-like C-terminal region-containing protein [Candidatus Binatia bacterium]